MLDSKKTNTDNLFISFKFPPDKDIGGIIAAKRIIKNNLKVDVLHNSLGNEDDLSFKEINNFIHERLSTSVNSERDSVGCIFNFINQGLKLIGDRQYNKIYSRSWYMSNHYLALEYKFRHPDVFWTAEFSDPVLMNMKGVIRNHSLSVLDNKEYIDGINSKIDEYNKIHHTDIDKLSNPGNTFYLAEFMTFLFADEIIFTNSNQRNIMLENYEEYIKKLVMDKSRIIHHPTLDSEYYHLANNELNLNKDEINIAYFGNFYYISRHFEPLFYAFESLNHKYKNKIKFHLFINKNEFLNFLTDDLEFKNNIIIREPLEYFEFLNATLKFDILLINDTITNEYFNINPYLPSKLSDYLGSNKDIWAIYEDYSTLSTIDCKYKSSVRDYRQSRDVLLKILDDYGYDDSKYSFDDNFYEKRINQLNKIIGNQYSMINRHKLKIDNLNKSNKKLKRENKEILSSNSWKLTSPLRKLFSFFRK